MQMVEVTVLNKLGLHARAAAKVVKTAESFNSEIVLGKSDGTAEADAKSILCILTLSASMGDRLAITATGDDAETAVRAIADLFESGFGE